MSVLLNTNRCNEDLIRELGYELNEARVSRRVFDYIQDVEKKEQTKYKG